MVACKTVCLRRLGGNRGGELRAGRFFASPKVTAAKLIEGWSDRTSLAVAGRHVLAVQDTSEVAVPTTACPCEGGGRSVAAASGQWGKVMRTACWCMR